MSGEEFRALRYTIFDPSGNITALVESPVEIDRQPAAAAALMRRHPAVEQVGFVRLDRDGPALRMAGGEFCGNAAMSAAALYLLRASQAEIGESRTVRLRVSGTAEPVEVRLLRESAESFRGGVCMPRALEIRETEFGFENVRGTLPLVRMEGISHILIEPDSAFFPLCRDRAAAERAVRAWCEALEADGLGLMFLEGAAPAQRLTPLVYVPGSGTVFWESSCASGSSAVGMALAARRNAAVSLTLEEPGGELRVESDPESGETWLRGRTRLTATY